MTFDDAIKKAKKDLVYDDNVWGVWTELLEDLKQEYAPTVEMTTFERTNAVGLLDFKRDELTFVVGSDSNEEPILDTLPKEYFSAWLHPETVKIVDNEE